MNIRDIINDYASRKPPVELKVHPDLPETFLDATIYHHEWAHIKRPNDDKSSFSCIIVNAGDSRTWVVHDMKTHELYPFACLEQDAKIEWAFECD